VLFATMKVSPSELEVFQSCPQRFIWKFDLEKKNRQRSNLSSSLGNIAHKVLASAHRGAFHSVIGESEEIVFNDIWNTYEKEEFEKIQSDWTNTVVPQPIRWPKYFAVKTSTQYLVGMAIKSGEVWKYTDASSGSVLSYEQPFPWVEKFLESENINLKGIPDLVKETSTGLEIVDYKTGNVADPEIFSMQMHVYLMLVNEVSGRKVTKLSIRDFTLQEKEIPIEQSMITKIKKDLASAESYLSRQKAPANASLKNCRFCNFKDVCNEFQLSDIQESSDPVFLEGEILQIHSSLDGSKVSLQLQIHKAIPLNLKNSVWISGLSVKSVFSVGEIVQIMDNLHLNDSINVVGSWNTIVSRKFPI